MKIGIIGAGAVALAVAKYALARGHEVVLSNKSGPDKLKSALEELGPGAAFGSPIEAAASEIVLLAVPWKAVGAALSGLPPWDGKVLIDTTNPFLEVAPKLVLADLGGVGASEIVADLASGARVVKAFNSIFMSNFEAGPRQGAARRVLFVSGDHEGAKSTVKDLISSFGFAVVDLGGLKEGGRMQQAGGPLAGRDLLISGQ